MSNDDFFFLSHSIVNGVRSILMFISYWMNCWRLELNEWNFVFVFVRVNFHVVNIKDIHFSCCRVFFSYHCWNVLCFEYLVIFAYILNNVLSNICIYFIDQLPSKIQLIKKCSENKWFVILGINVSIDIANMCSNLLLYLIDQLNLRCIPISILMIVLFNEFNSKNRSHLHTIHLQLFGVNKSDSLNFIVISRYET